MLIQQIEPDIKERQPSALVSNKREEKVLDLIVSSIQFEICVLHVKSLINTKLILLILGLFIADLLKAQTNLRLQVKDANGSSIPFATISYKGNIFSTDQKGNAIIKNYITNGRLSIHKFGFADTNLVISNANLSDSSKYVVVLRLKLTVLPEVVVAAAEKQEINPLHADFILDFELKEDYVIELLSEGIVLVVNANGELVSRLKLTRLTSQLVKDAYGDVYAMSEDSAFKLQLKNGVVSIDSKFADLNQVKWNRHYCDEVYDHTHYIRRYKDNNQTIAFFAVSDMDSQKAKMLKEIGETERKNAVAQFASEAQSLNQYMHDLGLNMMNANTDAEVTLVRKAKKTADQFEMNYVLPSYSVLKRIGNNIYLFAHDIDSMLIYDPSWNLLDAKTITYHHLKSWGKELIVNEEKTKVYVKLIEQTRPRLVELDVLTGDLKQKSTEIETGFPMKIRIKNDRVYYLSKQLDGVGYTVLSIKL